MTIAGEPILPPELEREVFEMTAFIHPGTIPTLLRVAKRVLIWIQPFLYRVIRTNGNRHMSPALLRAIATKPQKFFHDAVRHIAFVSYSPSISVDEVKQILGVCTGILSFGSYSLFLDPSVASFLAETRAQRLALNLGSLVELLPDIPLLPALTHLSLDSDTPRKSALRVLQECSRLELLFVHWLDEGSYKSSQIPHVYDVRFLVGLCDEYWNDWELGARGGADFWARGDDFVRRKRKGEIEGTAARIKWAKSAGHSMWTGGCRAASEFSVYMDVEIHRVTAFKSPLCERWVEVEPSRSMRVLLLLDAIRSAPRKSRLEGMS
ncbi:hypothetical protein B0H14DRAFT_2571075 [Mycena olivaceomarginata]|nr:hypothetical protein B0H14DRAFT_3662926 [Mycena olivaceomarginata]KAJ7870745.1 hypothetical protein B0H14DRAFT_2571075 [Mycena olivaceomarginata]